MIVSVDANGILPGRVGGIENYTIGLVEALRLPSSPAERVVILTRPENHALFSRFDGDRTKTLLIERPTHQGSTVTNWPALQSADAAAHVRLLAEFQRRKIEALRRARVDLVHFPANSINPLEIELPTVLNLHDLQHRHFPHYFTAAELQNRERWWPASANRADAIISSSQYVKADVMRQLHVEPKKVFVTHDAFESAFLQELSPERLAATRRRFGLPETYFLYPAAAWPHKNHERLIRAFAAAGLSDARLLLTGGNQTEAALPSLIESLKLGDRVRLLGRVATDDLIDLYRLATAMIFPSQYEAWSIPIMEAMACGCPVASSNVSSLPEEVGDAGLLFDPDDEAAMKSVIQKLAADADLRRTLARRGRERVRRFSPERFIGDIARAYDFAIQSHAMRKAA